MVPELSIRNSLSRSCYWLLLLKEFDWACLRKSPVGCYCQERRLVTVKVFLRIGNSYPCGAGTDNYRHAVTLKLYSLEHSSVWLLVLQLLHCKWIHGLTFAALIITTIVVRKQYSKLQWFNAWLLRKHNCH